MEKDDENIEINEKELNNIKKIKDKIKEKEEQNNIDDIKNFKINENNNINNNENDENENIFYKTFNNLEDFINSSNKKKINLKEKFNLEDKIIYFPSEKYLIEREDDIKKLESELDILYKEKNKLESEIVKLPEHPKTLKEIKLKRALNDKILLNENNINKVRIQIRKIKEF